VEDIKSGKQYIGYSTSESIALKKILKISIKKNKKIA